MPDNPKPRGGPPKFEPCKTSGCGGRVAAYSKSGLCARCAIKRQCPVCGKPKRVKGGWCGECRAAVRWLRELMGEGDRGKKKNRAVKVVEYAAMVAAGKEIEYKR